MQGYGSCCSKVRDRETIGLSGLRMFELATRKHSCCVVFGCAFFSPSPLLEFLLPEAPFTGQCPKEKLQFSLPCKQVAFITVISSVNVTTSQSTPRHDVKKQNNLETSMARRQDSFSALNLLLMHFLFRGLNSSQAHFEV